MTQTTTGHLECPLFKIVSGFLISNLGHWNLFVICDLLFGIYINFLLHHSTTLSEP
jgi:hypothetical protein